MEKEKASVSEVLQANRSIVLALLGLPIFGMLIAASLILYLKPDNMLVVLGVITFVGIQYIIMMFFFMKRVEALARKKIEENRVKK